MKERYRIEIFIILVLLSTNGFVQIFMRNNLNILQKCMISFWYIGFIFAVSEFIQTILYYKDLRSLLNCQCYSSTIIYKFFFRITPYFALFIFVFAWILFLTDSIKDSYKAFELLNILGISYFVLILQMRYNLVFVNDENLYLYKRRMPLKDISSYDIKAKSGLGIDINVCKIILYSGDEYSIRIDAGKHQDFMSKLM